ncbi:MAG TPA: TIGR01244 family phosphatase [Rhizobiales bacterium]|nr:TIGR01244 family phosphatase [Hyphomicrobiales bacterium]
MFFFRGSKPSIRKIDDRCSISGQIGVDDVKAIAEAGFKAIVCSRPDNEQSGQPAFADIAREARKHGLAAAHIPVSGFLTQSQAMRFRETMDAVDGPVLVYCLSGARAASLYSTYRK